MLYVLYALFFISCIVLVGSVLLQPGKTDAGALFTSNVSSAAFGPRGTASVLSKVTIVAATVFMLTALMISLPVFSGNVSVLQSTNEEAPAEAPANVPDANTSIAAPDANANSAPANTNAPSTDAPAANTEAPANE